MSLEFIFAGILVVTIIGVGVAIWEEVRFRRALAKQLKRRGK